MREFVEGELPLRPPSGERLGLDDEVWDKMVKCLDSQPGVRPAIKDIRSFLEPLHQIWIHPTPAGAAKPDAADENDSYVDFTCYGDGSVPSLHRSATEISREGTLVGSEESSCGTLFPAPAKVSSRTLAWVNNQRQRLDPFPKISRPGVTFEEKPVVFDISSVSTNLPDRIFNSWVLFSSLLLILLFLSLFKQLTLYFTDTMPLATIM